MSSQEDFSSQAFDSRNIDHSIILFIVDILKDNKILLHEQSIHNKVLENLNNNLAKELLSEKKLKIHTFISKENERYEKTVHFIVKKITSDPTDIPNGTLILHRPCSIVRPFSPDNSDEDNE